MSKVRFIVYDKPPGSRVYENEHRDAPVETILESHVGEKFVLSGCDIDEIPDLSTMPSLEEIHTLCSRGCVRLSQDFYYYNTKWRFAEKWTAPFFINERLLRGAGSIQKYRYENPYNTSMVLPCGWHFSYFQSVEDIRRKLESCCHKEYNSQKYKNREHIVKCIESGIDLFMRSNKKLIAAGAEGEALPEVFQRASLEIALLQRPLPPTDKN
jgi:hypothetical protein